MEWNKEIQKIVENGFMKNLIYDRLILSKDNFSKTNIRQISCFGITVNIVQGGDDKNYLIDTSKVSWGKEKSIEVIEAALKSQGVIKEIELLIN